MPTIDKLHTSATSGSRVQPGVHGGSRGVHVGSSRENKGGPADLRSKPVRGGPGPSRSLDLDLDPLRTLSGDSSRPHHRGCPSRRRAEHRPDGEHLRADVGEHVGHADGEHLGHARHGVLGSSPGTAVTAVHSRADDLITDHSTTDVAIDPRALTDCACMSDLCSTCCPVDSCPEVDLEQELGPPTPGRPGVEPHGLLTRASRRDSPAILVAAEGFRLPDAQRNPNAGTPRRMNRTEIDE